MATVVPTSASVGGDGNAILWTWAMVTANVEGLPFEYVQHMDLCWQSFATTQSTAVITIQGSNDGTNYFSMTNASGGAAATFSADGGKQTVERPRYVRPYLTTAGTGAVISVTCLARKNPVR